jgi:putative membrane protein
MMGPFMMRGFGWMFLLGIFWIVVIGLVIWGISVLLHRSNEPEKTANRLDSPLEILKRRYAQGEIDKEEYEAKKKDLAE